MDDCLNVHHQIVFPIQTRFERLLAILPRLRACALEKKSQVLDAFEREDLTRIQELMQDYHQLTRRVDNIQSFLAKWQN